MTAPAPTRQGDVLLGVATHAGLEVAVQGYIHSIGRVLYELVLAAEQLHDDGFTLKQFADLLRDGGVDD